MNAAPRTLAWMLAVALLVAAGSTAEAAFSPEQLKCREAIAGSGQKLSDTVAKTLVGCHKKRSAGRLGAPTDCNDPVAADDKGKISAAANKLVSLANSKCVGINPADVLYLGCPAPCDAQVPSISTFDDVGNCLACVAQSSVQALVGGTLGNPDPASLNKNEAKCHSAIGKGESKYLKTLLKERRKCQKADEALGGTDTSACINADPNGKIGKSQDKGEAGIDKSCSGPDVVLSDLDSCSDFALANLKACVFASASSRGTTIFESLYGLSASISTTTSIPQGTTTTTTTTSTTLPGGGQDPQCPDSGELILYAGVRTQTCTTNVDCEVDGAAVGECDVALGRCVTATDLDTGWTGLAHNADINDELVTRGRLSCPGPFDGGSAEPCGECTVDGLDTSFGDLCRCSNDNRAICSDGFGLDPGSCSTGVSCSTNADCKRCSVNTGTSCNVDADCPLGPSKGEICLNGLRQPTCSAGQCVGTCNCYFGPPLPLSSGNTPACVLNRFANDISGTANVDVGSGVIAANLKSVVFLGELITVPCPYCTGDTTPRDGVRDGVCVLGDNAGQSCDVQSRNETFPGPFGDGHSLDCFPALGKNVSGTGLVINLEQTTGVVSLPATIGCGFNFGAGDLEICPCGVCTGDTSLTCTSDADCTAIGSTGPCKKLAQGKPRQNQCSDTVCNDISGDSGIDGECNTGPSESFCDGVFRSSGEPYVNCVTNADCNATDCGFGVGVGLCGTCTLSGVRKCFLDPIVATGTADPDAPVGVAGFCAPQTSNPGINDVAGLPGPGRIANQARAKTFCASSPATQYVPGVGGCP